HTVKVEPGIDRDAERVDVGHGDIHAQSGVDAVDERHTQPPPQSEGKALETYHQSLVAENAALRQRHQECTRELQCQRELYDTRIASLSQSLTDQEREHKAEVQRQREVYEARIVSLSKLLSDSGAKNKSLSDSLYVSNDMCRRLAQEVLKHRLSIPQRETREHSMQSQILQLQAELSRVRATEGHSSPRCVRVCVSMYSRTNGYSSLTALTPRSPQRKRPAPLQLQSDALVQSRPTVIDTCSTATVSQPEQSVYGQAPERTMSRVSRQSRDTVTESVTESEGTRPAFVGDVYMDGEGDEENQHSTSDESYAMEGNQSPSEPDTSPFQRSTSPTAESVIHVDTVLGHDTSIPSAVVARRQKEWDKGLASLTQYLETHNTWPSRSDNRRISDWTFRQRKLHRNGKLPEDCVAALDELGIDWNPYRVPPKLWTTRLAELQKYLRHHGTWPSWRKGPVGTWVNSQRCAYRSGKLSAERVSALEELGIDWSPSQST
ncbi:hypothetical protein KIPB_004290, partial [Kipferlia bialata]